MSGDRRDSRLVLAADGGGAKTDLALLDRAGGVLSLVRGSACHAHHLGVEGSVRVLEELLERAIRRAQLGPVERPAAASAAILLAGADLPEELTTLRARIERAHLGERLIVDNDTLALLRAGTERGWGVAVVCGYGINCLARTPDGREVRFPSLGEISGDWGGGADVGMAGLIAAARGADGRGPRTALERAVPAHFSLSDPIDVARALHFGRMAKARLGELARVVLAVSNEDPVAAGIIDRMADEVVAFVGAAVRRLDLGRSDPDVVLGGSLLKAAARSVEEKIRDGVRELAPKAHVLISASDPIVGAALIALDALGADASAKIRARDELDVAVATLTADPSTSARRPSSLPQPAPG